MATKKKQQKHNKKQDKDVAKGRYKKMQEKERKKASRRVTKKKAAPVEEGVKQQNPDITMNRQRTQGAGF